MRKRKKGKEEKKGGERKQKRGRGKKREGRVSETGKGMKAVRGS